jgi:DNA primase
LLKLHAEAAEWFHENLVKGKAGAGPRLSEKRGIDRRIAMTGKSVCARQLGCVSAGRRSRLPAPADFAKRIDQARDENRPDGEAYDRFRGRIMFPIHNDVGEVIAFSGRARKEGGAKYLNSPETPLFRRAGPLWSAQNETRPDRSELRDRCEGQLDLITVSKRASPMWSRRKEQLLPKTRRGF